jgi:hypothetical protein
MSAYRNITKGEIRYYPDGPQSETVVAAGATFTIADSQDYIVGTQIATGQVEKIDLNAAPAKKAPKEAEA